jgi:ADP-ribose pyrophosphatase YjhB (NUDIX family)
MRMGLHMNATLITNIPDEKQAKRGWTVKVNDVPLERVTKIELHNPNFGTLAYGQTVPGYDGWSFHELGGGGAVVLPYACIDQQWYVGLVEQNRHNQGGKVLNAPRGFLNPGESHFKAASRELAEEMSLRGAPELLPGQGVNPNSAFFETAQPGEGVKFYAMKVSASALEQVDGVWRFKKGALAAESADTKAQKVAEQILGACFVPLKDATSVGDMFTVAGVGRLITALLLK